MYFNKALTDSDVKWSQHKKIISTTERRGVIAKVVPEGFSYFHVDFEATGGYAHVIEDPDKFPAGFGIVCAGCDKYRRKSWGLCWGWTRSRSG